MTGSPNGGILGRHICLLGSAGDYAARVRIPCSDGGCLLQRPVHSEHEQTMPGQSNVLHGASCWKATLIPQTLLPLSPRFPERAFQTTRTFF